MNYIAQVAVKLALKNGILSYSLESELPKESLIGCRCWVKIRNKKYLGIIWDFQEKSDFKLKPIEEIIDTKPIISSEQKNLINFCSIYYINNLGTTAHLCAPKNALKNKNIKTKNIIKNKFSLTPEQQSCVNLILDQNNKSCLLEGVTGSGKTLIYISVAQKLINLQKSILVLVPEISLTPQLVRNFETYLGMQAHVLHSNISPAKKRDILAYLSQSQAPELIIGARSAIFAPAPNLGLIIVDEEHDSSFKQDESPRYHARDLALWRGQQEHAKVILGSATPSLESIINTRKNKIKHIKLTSRYNFNNKLPEIKILDLRKNNLDYKNKILSPELKQEIKNILEKKLQIILFLNQRGFARFGICNSCGEILNCPSCSVSLTYYKNKNILLCHQCQFTQQVYNICPGCKQEELIYLGLGTERLEQEVRINFPDARVARLDRDIIQSQLRLESVLKNMHEHETDILIGTQMIAKGHDFQHVGLVGIICADSALSMPDFRAGEKTFQLLTQVCGRAGRGKHQGHALIQTFNPEHPCIKYAQKHDIQEFTKYELQIREQFSQPPFVQAALIRVEHKIQDISSNLILLITNFLSNRQIKILGPSPSPIEKISERYRFQCMVFSANKKILNTSLWSLKKNHALMLQFEQKRARLSIDVDPYNLF